jgi:flagellar protein FlbD
MDHVLENFFCGGCLMVAVTRLDGSAIMLNVDLIVTIERTPDTLVWLTTGDRIFLRETPEEIVERITRYKQTVVGAATLAMVGGLS